MPNQFVHGRSKANKGNLKIGHINVRSLQPHLEAVNNTIVDNELDLLGITETWLTADTDDRLLLLRDLTLLRRDYRGRGSGVGVYIHKSLDYSIVHTVSVIEHLTVKVRINTKTFVVCTVYRNHDVGYKSFITELESIISQCLVKYESLIILGDFNINALNAGDVMVRTYFDAIQDLSFTQLITEPTRGKALLDHVLVSDMAMVVQSGVELCEISDHDLVYVVVNSKKPHKAPQFLQVRDFSNFDVERFRECLRCSGLHGIYRLADIDSKVQIFNETILHLFEMHAPLKSIRVTKPKSPWLTDNVRLIMSLRDRAKVKFKASGREPDWIAYKELRNLTTAAIRAEKKAYLQYRLNDKNSKSLYKALKQMNIGCRITSCIPTSLANVEEINKHFTRVADESLDNTQMLNFYNTNKHPNFRTEFKFKIIDQQSVIRTINGIATNARGSDNLNIALIRQCGPYIVDHIVHIVNSCILESYYPSSWKEAIAIPFPKTTSVSEINQLRLISILPVVSKVLERNLAAQTQEYLDKYNILPNIQSGFRPAHSCTTALLCITDDILRASDEGKVTLVAALDFSRAFDTVNHQMLLAILGYIGMSAEARSLMESYLSRRSQRVRLHNITSESRYVTSGVPQGSILSPLMFAIYTHHLPSIIKYCKIHMYADDVQVYISVYPQNIHEAIHQLNQDLQAIANMSDLHSLKLNPKKSNIILFGSQSRVDAIVDIARVNINHETIPIVKEIKILGLWIDNTFRYRQHISKCLQKAYGNLKLLYPHRTYLPRNTRINLCSSLVLSQLNYCAEIFSSALDFDTWYRVQKLQNSCLRFIFGLRKFQHVSHTLGQTKWLRMRDRFKVREATLYHSILTTRKPPYLYDKITFRTDIHNINIRRKDRLDTPKHRTSLFERSFTYRISAVYNNIIDTIKTYPKNRFKAHLNKTTLAEYDLANN